MNKVQQILDEVEEKLYNKVAVKKLVEETTTDYDRAKHQGKIELLNDIRRELEPKK